MGDSGTPEAPGPPGSAPRRGVWIPGLVIEIVLMTVVIAGVMLYVVSRPRRGRVAMGEAGPIAAMRTYCGAQNIFHRTDYDGDGVLEYCGLGNKEAPDFTGLCTTTVDGVAIELIDKGFAGAKLGSAGAPPKCGYYFAEIPLDAEGEPRDARYTYALCAVPARYNRTGLNTFIVDVQGTVFQKDNGGRAVTRWPDTLKEKWTVCE